MACLPSHAGVAQLAAHPTCNRAVRGSSPRVGSDVSAGQRHIRASAEIWIRPEIGRLSLIFSRWVTPSLLLISFVCWSFGGLTTAEGAGHARGAGCGGAAVSGGAGGPGRGRGDRGGAPVWGGPADVARVAAPVCRRGWDREPGGSLVAAGVVSASDAGGGGGQGAGDPRCASGVGSVDGSPISCCGRASTRCPAGRRSIGRWCAIGDRPDQAPAAAGGLPAVGTGPVDGAVADGRDGPGAAGRRRRGEGGDRDR